MKSIFKSITYYFYNLFFDEAKPSCSHKIWVPLSAQMLFSSIAWKSIEKSITAPIGAKLPTDSRRTNFSNIVLICSIIIALFICSDAKNIYAQTNTDIYLMDIDLKGDNLNYTNLINITDRNGYDNQPHFSIDGNHLLFASIRKNEQSDIFKYNIERKTTEQLTDTEASEFSPTYFNKNKFISAVQQDVDSSQHLIQIKLKNNKRKVLLKKEKLIGYHSWISKKDIALFVVGEPHELHRAKKWAKIATKIDDKIGSALQRVPYRRAVGYQFFEDSTTCVMKEYYYKTKVAKTICDCVDKKAVSFVYLKNGNIISGVGQQLFLFDKRAAAKGWLPIADFSHIPNFDFYRIAINRKETQMALVVHRKL